MQENSYFLTKFIEFMITIVIVGCIFWLCPTDMKISSLTFVPLLTTLLVFIVVLLEYILCLKNKKMELNISPKIIVIDEVRGLVLAKFSELYTVGSYVSFYVNEGNFDFFIGNGFVESIQDDENRLQIKIANVKPEYVEKFANMYKNNIKIRPFANYNSLNNSNGDQNNG